MFIQNNIKISLRSVTIYTKLNIGQSWFLPILLVTRAELPYWFKAGLFVNFGGKIREIRLNPCEIRLSQTLDILEKPKIPVWVHETLLGWAGYFGLYFCFLILVFNLSHSSPFVIFGNGCNSRGLVTWQLIKDGHQRSPPPKLEFSVFPIFQVFWCSVYTIWLRVGRISFRENHVLRENHFTYRVEKWNSLLLDI